MVSRRLDHLLYSSGGTPTEPPEKLIVAPRVDVLRAGHIEPLLNTRPMVSGTPVRLGGIAIEKHLTPSLVVPRHEHTEHFLHLVLRGSAPVEVNTSGKQLRFHASPGLLFVLPRGTVDEVIWTGEVQRVAVSINSRVLVKALEETAHLHDIELTEHWELLDHHISTLLSEIVTDLEEQSPAGTMYGESLGNALSVYLVKRYAVWPVAPAAYKGGLPRYRVKRVFEYIAENLDRDLSLSELALVAGMSPHYFAELFRQSTGRTPHQYVLRQRLERAKQQLSERKHSIIEVAQNTGFQNPSHFARIFRQIEGTSPSRFRAEVGVLKHKPPDLSLSPNCAKTSFRSSAITGNQKAKLVERIQVFQK